MQFGAIIIGDEIMSGKRQDKHMAQAIATLGGRGLEFAWFQYLADDPVLITATLRRTLATDDVVFSFGGIGATPDDYTRQCAADALGVGLILHPDAEVEIRGRFGADITPQRLAMGEFPRGSRIIPNPYNRVPGFSFKHHHFLPGFPQMAWPMMEWVLDTHYPEMRNLTPDIEEVITVHDTLESVLLDVMNELVLRYPDVRFSSLPHIGEGEKHQLELGVKGENLKVGEAMLWLKQQIEQMNLIWTDATPR